MADSNTTNYSLVKPEVGASEDTWGTKLNQNLDTIDTKLDDIEGKSGTATLKHTNSTKLQTTATGVDVTGTVTADGLTVENGTVTLGGEGISSAFINTPEQMFFNVDSNNTPEASGFEFGVGRTGSTGGKKRLTIGGDGDVSFYEDTGTTAKFVWDSSAESLGIGTSTPVTQFNIDYPVPSSSDQAMLSFSRGRSDRYASIGLLTGSNSNFNGLSFYTCNNTNTPTQSMVIDSSGNVGIGTSSPSATLHVAGNLYESGGNIFTDSTSGVFFAGNGSYTNGVYGVGTNNVAFNTGGSERARITSSGTLLVGGSADYGTGRVIITQSADDKGIALADSALSYTSFFHGNSNGTKIGNNHTQPVTFFTNNTERARIDSSGNFYVGSPTSSYFSRLTAGNGCLFKNGNASDSGVTVWATSARGADTGRQFLYFQYSNTNLAFQVFNNGNTQNLNNSYGAISDIKLKENIKPASSQWDDIKAIKVCSYNLKETGEKHIGVIAQQLEEVDQVGLVDEFTERDENGELTQETTKTVKYSVLYMKAVKALQEAMERIEQLEARIETLENN